MRVHGPISDPWLSSPATQAVFDGLEKGGFMARAVGGIVRNSLLGLPATDIDVATTALPDDTLRLAAAAGLKTIPTGLAHGTVTVISQGIAYEVTTLRRDITTDGRHAEVAYTADWAADAARRDFTINALYCDRNGVLFDPLGGIADLAPVRIRFIGDARRRIEEDYLRILRFFRFTAIYTSDGALDPEGLAACVQNRCGLARISGERIAVELLKLLAARHAIGVTRALVEGGVLTSITDVVPQWAQLAKLAEIERHLQLAPDPVLRLAALAVANTKECAALDARLKLAGLDRDQIARALVNADLISPGMGEIRAREVLYRVGGGYLDAVQLKWTRSTSPPDDAAFSGLATLPRRWAAPVFALSGRDVLAAGLSPGPQIGILLDTLEREWIASDFALDRTALLAQLSRMIANGSD
jgi:poly(A) polymerase